MEGTPFRGAMDRAIAMTTEPNTIERLQATVDELDRLLVDLHDRRARLALAVSREKARLGAQSRRLLDETLLAEEPRS